MKNYRIYAVLLGLLFTVFILIEYYRPQPIDWNQTFSNKDKIPYGTYVLFNLLPDLFKNQPVKTSRLPVASQLESNNYPVSNYVFVNNAFEIDSLDLQALLTYVKNGNQVFISAREYTALLEDTLHFTTHQSFAQKPDSVQLSFTHSTLQKAKPLNFANAIGNTYFELKKKFKGKMVGKNSADKPNFIWVPYGQGAFLLNSVPQAFCNYHVLSVRQSKYATLALSHLPVQPVLWDEYQKQGRAEDDAVFRVLLAHEALKYAYYLTLFGLLLFVVFEGKRTQRIIPILEKPRNTTLEFVQVVGNLYFNYKNHRIIADKKINYFLEYLRRHYHEPTSDINEEFIVKIAAKSGVPLPEVTSLLEDISGLTATSKITEQQLWHLNNQLENFYRQAGG